MQVEMLKVIKDQEHLCPGSARWWKLPKQDRSQ
jgi:hypothetical protein